MEKNRMSLLNFEGDVFTIVKKKSNGNLFDIIDYKGYPIKKGIIPTDVLAIYDGLEYIGTSDGKTYNIAKQHADAKPLRENLLKFLNLEGMGVLQQSNNKKNLSISFELTDKQQKEFDEWKDAIKKIYGEYGHFEWTISPTAVCSGLVVTSKLAKASLDLTDVDSW